MTEDFVAPTEELEPEEYGTPIPPIEEPKSQGSRIWIIVLVVILVICCCCVGGTALVYFYLGDLIMEGLGFYYFLPTLLL